MPPSRGRRYAVPSRSLFYQLSHFAGQKMEPATTEIPPEQPRLTPDIVLHIAETLARRNHRTTLRELAMTRREHFFAALPALYREISLEIPPDRTLRIAEGDALGANRHSFIRTLHGANLWNPYVLEVITKAKMLRGLVAIVAYFSGSTRGDQVRALSQALADKVNLSHLFIHTFLPVALLVT